MSDLDPFDLDDGEDTLSASDEVRLRAVERENDMRWLIDQPRGRRILRQLLEQTGVFQQSFTGDPLATAFREGVRSVGLKLFDELAAHAPPLHFASILTEDQHGK